MNAAPLSTAWTPYGMKRHDGPAGQAQQVLREDAVRLMSPEVVEQPPP